MDEITSEDELENYSPQKAGPLIGKHAYSKTILNPSSNPSGAPNGGLQQVSAVESGKGTSLETIPTKPSRDKINNLTQKETSMEKVGLTRRLPYQRIVEALNAVKRVEYRDSSGNVKYKDEPDFDKNKWGTEMALKAFGDLIERKEVEHSVDGGTLERYKQLSVSELKARALDLLAGKAASRLPVIDVPGETVP